MATENEQVIIDVIPQVDASELKAQIANLRKAIENRTLKVGVELADVDPWIKGWRTRIKNMLNQYRTDYAEAIYSNIKEQDKLAEATRKNLRNTYNEAKRNLNYKGTFLDPTTATKEAEQYTKAFKKASTGIFAWTPSQTQAQNKYWKIATENAQREAIKSAKKVSDAYNKNLNTKAPIGAMGVQVAPSGTFSSLATKQTYNSATDFKANASMENTAKAAIAQSAKLGKQAAHEFNNSFLGSFMSGSSFGHKIGTTLQYAMAGTGIFAAASAITSIKDAVVESDKYLHMFMGVLELSEGQAKALQSSIFSVGKEIGGTVQGMSEATLMFGRAGLDADKLAKALETASMAANVSGDNIENITEMLAAWATVYPESEITHLGDMMAKVANESLLSIDGLKTATSYITAAGASAGITADQLIQLTGAWKQTGKADSIVGTEMRRFFSMVEGKSEDARKAYWALGVDIDKVNEGWKKGGKESEAATLAMFNTIKESAKDPERMKAFKEATSQMDVLIKQTLDSNLKVAESLQPLVDKTNNVEGTLKTASDKIALSYEKMWERIVFAGKEAVTKFEEAFKNGFAGADASRESFDIKMKELGESLNDIAEVAGKALGSIVSVLGKILENITPIVAAFITYKGTLFAIKGINMALEFSLWASSIAEAAKEQKKLNILTASFELLKDAAKRNPKAAIAIGTAIIAGGGAYALEKYSDAQQKVINNAVAIGKAERKNLEIWKGTTEGRAAGLGEAYNKQLEAIALLEGQIAKGGKPKATIDHLNKTLAVAKSRLEGIRKEALALYELPEANVSAEGAYTPKDGKDADRATREAQRRAQDILDAKLAAIRLEFEAEANKYKKLGTFNAKVEKDLKLREETSLRIATEEAKGVDDHTKKVLKAKEAEAKAQGDVYELANKANKEAAKKASTTLADNRILQATNEYTKAAAELSKAKLEAEMAYNEELEKGTSEVRAKALQEELVNKATVEYQNKILELDKKRTQERIKLQQETDSMLEDNKTQQRAITDEYLKFLGYSERALELEQLKANVAKETQAIYRDQEAYLASKYAGDKDVDTGAQITVDDSVIQKLSTINDKELQHLALMEYQAEFQKAFAAGLDEQAINLDGILAKYQAIADKISNLKLKVDIEIAKDGFDSLSKIPEYMKNWVNSQGEAEGQLGRTQKALKGLVSFSEKSAKNDAKNKSKLQELDKKRMDGVITEKEYQEEKDKIATEGLFDQIGAYSALAGAASGFFEEGSKGAKTMQAISATLGIAQGIQAIISAWGSAPFPANIPAVAATTAAVLPMIGQLTSLGGSGGGGISSGMSTAQVNSDTAKYESDQANFIVDRLDRQIELLESIDKGGTSAKTKTTLAGSTFESDLANLWADLIGTANRSRAVTIDRASNITGNKLTDIQYVIGWLSNQQNAFSAADWAWLDLSRGDILQFQSDLEQAVSDFALSLADVRDIVNDSSEGFKEIYDSLSGTNFYKLRDLTKAYEELGNSIVGNTQSSMLSYISKAVTEMEKFGEDYLVKTKVILSNGTIDEQVASLKELSDAFGITFNNSTEEALNFLDSIELLSEAMIRSRENASQFLSSLLSQQQQAESLANVVGVQLAGDVGGLAELFIKLRDDIDGLTDADLNAINANLELLKNTDSLIETQNDYNESLTKTQESLSTLEGALSNIRSTIEKLRGAAGGADYTMEMFRQSMATALSLKGTDNYDEFAKAVQEAAGYSSVLMDSSNFEFSRDQRFAQAVAANQFASLEDATLDQIDYLKMIEENTRAMVMQLSGSIDNLSSSINSQLASEIISRGTPDILKEQWVNQGGGIQTWLSTGGASAINNTITDKLEESYQISDAISFIQDKLAQNDLLGIYNEAVRRGISSTSLDAMMGWAAGTSLNWAITNNLPAFAQGTQNVPYDMVAQIHKGEAIVPKPQAEAWRNGRAQFGMNADGIITAINNLGSRMASVEKVLNDSRDIQSGCLETLQLIEEVS